MANNVIFPFILRLLGSISSGEEVLKIWGRLKNEEGKNIKLHGTLYAPDRRGRKGWREGSTGEYPGGGEGEGEEKGRDPARVQPGGEGGSHHGTRR